MSTRSTTFVLTARDRDLLITLALRVKLLSLGQVRRTWWPDAATNRELRRRVRVLQVAGLIDRVTVVAGPLVVPTSPLAIWTAGGPMPDFQAVILVARTRWCGDPRAYQALVATAAAAHLVGGRARSSRPAEVTHDLHLTEVFLRLRGERPLEAERWTGEAVLSVECRAGEKVPDALLRLPGRCIAVEVCGASYTPAKLREFHEYCASRRYGYELW